MLKLVSIMRCFHECDWHCIGTTPTSRCGVENLAVNTKAVYSDIKGIYNWSIINHGYPSCRKAEMAWKASCFPGLQSKMLPEGSTIESV
jgi:hypothetical protein